MAYKRILVVQDISCVGQCSMTVALPILSACGHEVCILPTAILSTHTGGFGKPAIVHTENVLEPVWRHWQENAITFDAILVGYIGNIRGVEIVGQIADNLLSANGLLIVDPALADHGKVYTGLDGDYVQAMQQLCRRADIILPNVTEAAMFSGCEYREDLNETYVNRVLEKLAHPCVVLTGIGYGEGETGVILLREGRVTHYSHRKMQQNYHGTGDMFAACFTGALMQGKTMQEAVRIGADFVCRSIENTAANPAHWYGVKFETALPELIRDLEL